MAGAALAFASTIVVTRVFGSSTAGVYFQAIALASIAITISRLGLDLPTMRLVSTAEESSEAPTQRQVLRVAALHSGTAALVLSVVFFAGAGFLAVLFREPALGPMVRWTSVGVLPAAMGVLCARALTGVGHPEIAEFGQRAGFHIVFLLVLAALFSTLSDLALGAAFSLAYVGMLVLLFGAWNKATQGPSRLDDSRALRSELISSGLPLLIASAISLVITWSDTLMLGYFLDSTDVGVYGVAARVASVVSFVLLAAGSIAGPKFASLSAESDRVALERVFRRAAKGSGLAALAIAIPLVILAPQILSLFGENFSEGATALRLLVGAQLIHSTVGLVALLLAMAKREQRILYSTALAAALNILLNTLLIPKLGISGAAISTIAALLLLNGMNTVWVHRDLSVSLIPRRLEEKR